MGTGESSFPQRLSVNIWARIIHHYLFEPYTILNYVFGVKYTNFLERTLPLFIGGCTL
jgi:hypothetical protein